MKKLPLLIMFVCILLGTQKASSDTLVTICPNVYMLSMQGGNVTILITDEGPVVVDAGESEAAGLKIQETLKKLTDKPIALLVLTHYHFDHINGLSTFPASIPVLAHNNTLQNLKKREQYVKENINILLNKKDSVNILLSNSSSDSADFEKNDSLLKSIQQSLNELTSLNFVYPNEIMTEEFNIVKGNDTIIIKNNGTAHTDGDLSVFFKNKNVMVLGDMLFTNMYPYIDYMSNLQNWANELRNYSKLNIPYYIPGHGAVSKSTDLIVLADYLDNIKSKIVLLKSEGKTLEDAKKLSFPEINNLSPMDFRIQNIEAVWNQ